MLGKSSIKSYISSVYLDSKKLVYSYKSNVFWMNLCRSLNILTAIIFSVTFARLASHELYGQYIFVISIVSLFSLIGMPGVRTTIFRSVSQGEDGFYWDATKFSFSWALLGVPMLILTGIYFYVFKTPVVGLSLISASLFFPFVYALKNWKNFLKAKENFSTFVVYESSIAISKTMMVLLVLITGSRNLVYLTTVYFLVISVLNILYFVKSLKLIDRDGYELKWKTESYEYTLLDFSSYSFSKLDRVLIGFFLAFGEVAIYNIAMKMADTIFKFIKSSIEALLPGFFKDEYQFKKFYPIFLLLFIIPVVLQPVVEHLIVFLYTERYIESVFYARIYLFAVPFYFMSYVSSQALIKNHLSREVNKAKIASLVLFLITSVILIPSIGLLGGLIASLIYYPVQTAFCLYYLKINNSL